MRGVGMIVAIVFAVWIYNDAQKLCLRGASVSPGKWAAFTFLLLLIALPIYLVLRFTVWRDQIRLVGLDISRIPQEGAAEDNALPAGAADIHDEPWLDEAVWKKHSGRGIASALLFLIVSMLCGGLFVILVLLQGDAQGDLPENSPEFIIAGVLILVALVAWLVGATLGYAGLTQPDHKRFFAITGLVLNTLGVIGTIALMIVGLAMP